MAVHHRAVVQLSAGPRSPEQRRADVLHRLEHDVDCWVATAGSGPHLVPLSLDWVEGRVVLATGARTPTARNLLAGGRARLALGGTRDVVAVEAALERHQAAEEVAQELALRAAYRLASRSGGPGAVAAPPAGAGLARGGRARRPDADA